MSNKIALIDYGLGNLFSVARALTFAKADWFFANKPGELKRADKLVLPGVGAFADGMKGLKAKKLDKAIKAEVDKNKPILGI
ncbi:MAG TPA: imidazole glycerol phosphate synthase subunit HisH, partial [Patescibacteria group bacterium]|nr:imidazole glycerol phosphate synthase subunit HisH [Patescibacteria group bacterium]